MNFRRLFFVILFLVTLSLAVFDAEQYKTELEIQNTKQQIIDTEGFEEDKLDRYYNFYVEKGLDIKDVIVLVNEDIDLIKEQRYQFILNLMNDPYYIKKNLKKYIDYFAESNYKYDLRTTVSLVNTQAYMKPYTETHQTNINDGKLMLCNRYNGLPKDYKGLNLVDVNPYYSTSPGAKMNEEAYKAFLEVKKACEPLGHWIYIRGTNAYRSYNKQQESFDKYVKNEGMEVALVYAAKPGFSEHQTGYAMDIMFDFVSNAVYSYKDYQWMLDNCWKFGFIVRYPEGFEMITRNEYEPWHYRYVGKEVAQYIHEHNITFDEYYSYFVADNSITTEEFVEMFN